MKPLKLLGIVTIVILALTAIAMTGTATALEVLPTPSAEKPVKFTDKGGASTPTTLKDALEAIECAKNKSKGEFTSTTLGKVEVTFEVCRTLGAKVTCTGLSDKTAGNITFKGEVHFTDGLLTEKEVPTLALLASEVIHFTCSIVLLEWLKGGCIAAHILEESLDKLVSVIHAEWLLKEKIHGDPDIPFINLPTESECGLLVRVNEGKEEFMGAMEGLEEIENCEQGGVKCTFLLHTK